MSKTNCHSKFPQGPGECSSGVSDTKGSCESNCGQSTLMNNLVLSTAVVLAAYQGTHIVPKDVVTEQDYTSECIHSNKLGTVKQTRKGIDAEFLPGSVGIC